jgi:hypothetical protein
MPFKKGKTGEDSFNSRRHADDDDDEEEYTTPKKVGSKGLRSEAAESLSGWERLKQKAQEKSSGDLAKELIIKSGEQAIIQVLENDPYVFDAHVVKASGRYPTLTCQKEGQAHCLMCNAGLKKTTKAAFRVLDYRGEWDKDRNKYKWGSPTERVWVMSTPVAMQLLEFVSKKGKKLSQIVLDISKSGKKTSTRWNFEIAVDDKTDKIMKPVDWEVEMAALEVVLAPKEDDELIALGFENPDDED